MKKIPKRPKRPGEGAPVKLTPEIHQTIINAIKLGSYVETAAALAGIHKDSYYEWLKKGAKQKTGIYKEFSDGIKKALATGELRDLSTIDKAASAGTWQAAAWKLERRFPKRWGKSERHEITGKDGGPLTFTQLITELETDEEEASESASIDL